MAAATFYFAIVGRNDELIFDYVKGSPDVELCSMIVHGSLDAVDAKAASDSATLFESVDSFVVTAPGPEGHRAFEVAAYLPIGELRYLLVFTGRYLGTVFSQLSAEAHQIMRRLSANPFIDLTAPIAAQSARGYDELRRLCERKLGRPPE
jgi:hypothetical protein